MGLKIPILTRRIIYDKNGKVISDTIISHLDKVRAWIEVIELIRERRWNCYNWDINEKKCMKSEEKRWT